MHVDAFLQELPASAFQAVLQHLQGPDFASLRLINHCISSRAAAAPYITLRLSASTTREQLRAWARATRRLQHAPSIHIICCGCISPAVFDAALELLSLRGNVRELHLIGSPGSAPASAPHAASLPTLKPLNRLAPRLKTLQALWDR
ncbi:hypothetical protein OEZ86_013917 [Tetradesmus obliquus]|nr:hypothetical protein OEZ86_013917 [Tetradesmus obliquus]